MLNLGSQQTAWHFAHRIRHAMAHEPMRALLRGRVEVDETHVGGKPRPCMRPTTKLGIRPKVPVVALVERGGNIRDRHVERVTAKTLRAAIQENVHPTARLNTDELLSYKPIGRRWEGGHDDVRHASEYVHPDNSLNHINTAESFLRPVQARAARRLPPTTSRRPTSSGTRWSSPSVGTIATRRTGSGCGWP